MHANSQACLTEQLNIRIRTFHGFKKKTQKQTEQHAYKKIKTRATCPNYLPEVSWQDPHGSAKQVYLMPL